MDNLTHSLTGLALARAGLKKYSPHGTLLVILAANLPDIDMLSWVGGRLKMLEMHRGYTHSLVGLPVVAVAAVLLTAVLRWKRLPWAAAWAIACVGVGSHLLLDWSMSYGVRLLLPFSSRWYYLDLFSLTDWVVLAVLAAAWLGPMLGRLVSDEIGSRHRGGQGWAIFALVFFGLYGGFRALMHERAMAQLQSRVYDDVMGGPAIRMAAFAQSGNPMAWSGIVESEHAYGMYDLSAMGNFDPAFGTLLYKASWNPLLERVSETEAIRYFLYFARFPYWQVRPASDNWRDVAVWDLRFGPPGANFFVMHAAANPAGQVQSVGFGGTR